MRNKSYRTNVSSTVITLWITFWLVVVVACGYGWVQNIIHLFRMTTVMSGEGAVRIVGIFVAPLGAVLGWFF